MDFLNSLQLSTAAPSELLLHLANEYGLHLVVLCLSAMTIFRREMSCNHCYAEEEKEEHAERTITPEDLKAAVQEGDWDETKTEELLESLGMYCSGASLLPAVLHVVEQYAWLKKSQLNQELAIVNHSIMTEEDNLDEVSNLFAILNTDNQVHILSFLHLRDILSFEGASRSCQCIAGEPSLWRAIWQRDYAWVIHDWEIGRQSASRSGHITPLIFDKFFYARFQLCWLNYVLAGQNTYESCLVGLGGHVYDMSLFLASHPGSPETVMAHAGKDATEFFACVRHSTGAYRLAQSLCVVVDTALQNDSHCCGLRPTQQTRLVRKTTHVINGTAPPNHRTLKPRIAPSLYRVRAQFLQEEARAKVAASRYDSLAIAGEANVYFDPLLNKWRAWYTDKGMQLVFIDCP